MTNAAERPLSGPKVLLEGPSGSGKTTALGTLGDWCATHQKEMFVLFTENSADVFLGYWRDKGTEVPPCIHWHSAITKPLPLKSLLSAADSVGKLSYESITKMVDPNRGGENNSFWKILTACADFPDDRTGKKFGPVDSWGNDKVFAIDSLSELSNAAMKMVIGGKPTASQPDYGVAQNNIMNFLRLCTQGTTFTFAMTAHVDRINDEVTGTSKIMTKALGKALGSEIPTLFSDVILTVREGAKFTWSTDAYATDTKTRSLGYRSGIAPDFAQIMDVWLKRGGK